MLHDYFFISRPGQFKKGRNFYTWQKPAPFHKDAELIFFHNERLQPPVFTGTNSNL
jgi:hypothetical protein